MHNINTYFEEDYLASNNFVLKFNSYILIFSLWWFRFYFSSSKNYYFYTLHVHVFVSSNILWRCKRVLFVDFLNRKHSDLVRSDWIGSIDTGIFIWPKARSLFCDHCRHSIQKVCIILKLYTFFQTWRGRDKYKFKFPANSNIFVWRWYINIFYKS